ncbi:MAG: hypothetical protein H8E76_06010 [Helicobacteraceae bacterium]|nr:hypothetical protein [Candidatus Sulfurimonas ponti]
MLHPVAAHFAIVLPLVSLLLGVLYIIKPSELMSKISTRFMVFASLFLIAAFFTGKEDGAETYILLSQAGKALLLEHKDFGLYLSVAMFVTALIKLLGCKKNIFKLEVLSVALLLIISAGIFYQGKIGGELTYTYGANVEKHSDGMDCLEEQAEDEAEE